MQTGEYITRRQMVGIVEDICARRGIKFTSLSDDWLLELTSGEKTRRILGYKFSLNDAVASSIAGDKVATHLLLERAGLPSVRHVLLRPKVTEEQKQPLREWAEIVVKPLDGSGGYGVRRFTDVEAAVDWIESTDHPAWAASPFVDIKREIRLVLLDGEPLIAYEKQPVVVEGLKMFNLGLGARPSDINPSSELLALAARAQAALGLRLSAVDVIESVDGEYSVLEVNSGFMMEHYIRHSDEYKEQAARAYEKIIDAVFAD